MSFSQYEAYKDSGVEWFGDVPEHWQVHRLDFLADILAGYPFDSSLFGFEGTPVIRMSDFGEGNVRLEDAKRVAPSCVPDKALAQAGDILLGLSGSVSNFAIVRDMLLPIAVNQRVAIIRTDGRKDQIVRWFLESNEFIQQLLIELPETTIQNIAMGQLRRCKLPTPPLSEQHAIAAFLDRETAKIDTLVGEQQRLIELLKEKKQAVISHAVTKGLNPDAPMKDSGVEWLGEVPEHWQAGKIRFFARLESGHTPSRQHPEYWENCTIPWFSLADVWQIRDGGVTYISETKELVSELGLANSAARLLPKGTVILSRTASVGFSAIMGCAMATTQDFANWICGPELVPEFLLAALRAMKGEFDRLRMGSTHQTIYMPDIAKLALAVPPLNEQKAIVSFLALEMGKIDDLISTAESAISLLQERRSALISAAVTGKIDVRRLVSLEAEAA